MSGRVSRASEQRRATSRRHAGADRRYSLRRAVRRQVAIISTTSWPTSRATPGPGSRRDAGTVKVALGLLPVRRPLLPLVHRRVAGTARPLRRPVLLHGDAGQRTPLPRHDVRRRRLGRRHPRHLRQGPSGFAESTTYPYARQIVAQIFSVYALRMAAVFQISQATLWLRTGVMPRWMAFVTYPVALVLLFVLTRSRVDHARLPGVGLPGQRYILVVNLRGRDERRRCASWCTDSRRSARRCSRRCSSAATTSSPSTPRRTGRAASRTL